jgi:hypothetical protein
MARVVALLSDFEAGRLPPVCVKTGDVADGFVRMEFAETPDWV